MRRCTNGSQDSFAQYGARGIGVSAAWTGEGGFERFLDHIGPIPSDQHQLDRIDGASGYEPGNVRWATSNEQQRNKSTNHRITVNGETLCLVEWANRLGVGHTTILRRIERGWSEEDAVTTPVKGHHGDTAKNVVAIDAKRKPAE